MYDHGRGVPQDHATAAQWYRRAADQGHAAAQDNLGSMYQNGEGVPQSEIQAHKWFNLAAAQGIDKAKKSRHLVESRMMRPEIVEAQRLASIAFAQDEGPAHDRIAPISTAFAPAHTAQQVFNRVWQSVVVVHLADGRGSGVIVKPNTVATNHHVVADGTRISVYPARDKRVDTTGDGLPARIIRADRERDLCLLEVRGLNGKGVQHRNYDSLKAGETVYAIGAPLGLDMSITQGVISRLRTVDGHRRIQTDAAISPGSSGGGLFDEAGNLIGLTTSGMVGEGVEGLNFAIPADLIYESSD